jgi:hypothetical protein
VNIHDAADRYCDALIALRAAEDAFDAASAALTAARADVQTTRRALLTATDEVLS